MHNETSIPRKICKLDLVKTTKNFQLIYALLENHNFTWYIVISNDSQ